MDVRNRYAGVVLLSALIVGFETVAIEGALRIADLSLYLVSSVPLICGGLILLAYYPRSSKKFAKDLKPRGWAAMILICVLASAGVLLWYHAVDLIGASKEAILGGGSSEVLFIVVLSGVFLGERLKRWEVVGSFLVIGGVFVVLANTESLSLTLGQGEIEAIVSSLLLAFSVILVTKLLRIHDVTPFSGIRLLLSGIFTIAFGTALGLISWPSATGWGIMVVIGIFPALGLLTYNAGLPKIGASLTSVLFALCGIMTVGVQLLVLFIVPDADIQLPSNLALAIAGSMIAFIGVFLLNLKVPTKRPLP